MSKHIYTYRSKFGVDTGTIYNILKRKTHL